MQQNYTVSQLAAMADTLAQMADEVLAVDPANGAVLDPATLKNTGERHFLPPLDAAGRGWRPVPVGEDDSAVQLFFYRTVCVEGRDVVLAMGHQLAGAAPEASREANAFHRLLRRYCEELCQDYVTGTCNGHYVEELYAPAAAARAALGPLSLALVRVNECAALRAETEEAADRCLNVAAGLLRTAMDPDWPCAVLARVEDDVFLIAAGVEQAALEAALQNAIQNGRRQYSITLARRGTFTVSLGAAGWAEAGNWEAMRALAAQRLANA